MKRLFFAVALALVACHSNKHHGSEKREGRTEEEEEEEEEAFGVPIASCACRSESGVITLHAPREDRILWWFGVKKNGSDKLDELAIRSSRKQHVIPPSAEVRMLMTCAPEGVVVLVRDDSVAAWRVTNYTQGDARLLWSTDLPKPLDVSGIDAPIARHTRWNVGCKTIGPSGAAFDVQLQDGVRGSISMRDGTWTPK